MTRNYISVSSSYLWACRGIVGIMIVLCCEHAKCDDLREAAEKIAIQQLSASDRATYAKQKPYSVVRKRLDASSFSGDEITAKLIAIQRSTYKDVRGWRLVLLSRYDLLVFHVSDAGKQHLLLRESLPDQAEKAAEKTAEKKVDEGDPFSD